MSFDVDIDVQSFTDRDKLGVRGSILTEKKTLKAHPSARYIDTNMPVDGMTNLAAIPYEAAEELGFVKIDILSNSSYDGFASKQEI